MPFMGKKLYPEDMGTYLPCSRALGASRDLAPAVPAIGVPEEPSVEIQPGRAIGDRGPQL